MTPRPATTWDLRELPADTDLVLTGRQLRPDVAVGQTSRFGEDVWRLEPAILQQHIHSRVLHFATVPHHYRQHAKQLCFAMLAGPLPAGEKRQSPGGVHGAFTEVRRFLRWLDERPPPSAHERRPSLGSLTAEDLADYHRHLTASCSGLGTRENARRAVRLLWRYRHGMTDPLTVDPRHADGWSWRRRPRENTTERIPEPVLQPLITWALRFVDDFGGDILTAEDRRQQLLTTAAERRGRYTGLLEQLRDYLDAHIDNATPLPGRRGMPNMVFIAADVGRSVNSLSKGSPRAMLYDAVAKVGITEHTWLHVPISGVLDGKLWTHDIAVQHPTRAEGTLRRMLQIACYIAVAFFSGMRDSEIKHLRRGCLHPERDTSGTIYRWRVSGTAFKGHHDPAGAAATWVIGHPAARAITVLEQLQHHEQPLLFAHLPNSGAVRAVAGRAPTGKATNAKLAQFITWINTFCAEQNRTDDIPAVNGRTASVSTRQFRRTLAWFIARCPGGSIAGAIQYRHLSVQMFEGYAGTTDSGFRAEVESEHAIARGEQLLTLADTHEHTLSGPAASEARRRLERFSDSLRFTGHVVTDPQRLKRLMDRADPAVYPGTFATCVFNPDKALCRPDGDHERVARPALDGCRPLDCSNVALTRDNLAALHTELITIDHDLGTRPSLPPLLIRRLSERRDHISSFIARHDAEPTP